MKVNLIILTWILCNSAANAAMTKMLQAGADDIDITFYHLDLHVSDSSTYIEGSATILLKSVIPSLQQVVLDLSTDLHADSVTINGKPAQFLHNSDIITIELIDKAGIGNPVAVKIHYHGLGKYSGVQSGIYSRLSSSWNKRITWTLSEPFSAKNWFPCKQSLTDKADSVYVFLSTNSNLKAGSNGILSQVVLLPDQRVRYEWKSTYPIAYYLISFSVSDYLDYSFYVTEKEGNDSILVQNYLYNDSTYLDQNKASIDKTADLLLLYSDLFGPYPFRNEKYGHCVAPFSGGMEHQTMTTLVNFSFLLVAHELAHQWFGDYVTCSSWQDIWINEGFASYAEYLAYQYLTSQEAADNWISGTNDYVKSVTGGSIYVPETMLENEGRIFDSRLSYKKGASIIHMLRQEIGNDTLFFNGLSEFLMKYKNGNASGADFRDHMAEIAGRNFDQFFNQWYFGQGYPIHSTKWYHRNDTLYISSIQTVSSTTPFFDVLLDFKVSGTDTDTLISFRQTSNDNNWQAYIPGNITLIEPDPYQWLLIKFSEITWIPNDTNGSGLRIIPNPARYKVFVELDSPVGKYSLFLTNVEGQILNTIESSEQRKEIDVARYPSGMYFVIIRYGNTSHYGKFVIN